MESERSHARHENHEYAGMSLPRGEAHWIYRFNRRGPSGLPTTSKSKCAPAYTFIISSSIESSLHPYDKTAALSDTNAVVQGEIVRNDPET